MKLSRKWLNEFVDVREVSDHDFAEAMTISGSKVEITEVLNDSLKNVVAGRILSMEKHRTPTICGSASWMWARTPPPQIVTGAGTSTWGIWCPLPGTSPCCPAA